ncbi:hypothetical protein [Azospirillum largimobile]
MGRLGGRPGRAARAGRLDGKSRGRKVVASGSGFGLQQVP